MTLVGDDMNNEIEVPGFVNDNYYKKKSAENRTEKRAENERQRKIKKLKIYKKTIKLLAFGATLGLVVANAPKIEQAIQNVVNDFIEYDNQNFNEDKEQEIREVEELTGRSVEEIMESGRTK